MFSPRSSVAFCLLLFGMLLPGEIRAMEPFNIECAEFERSKEGSILEIRCQLELENAGDTTVFSVAAQVADAGGAEVEEASILFGEIDPGKKARADREFVFSFDYKTQEPPQIGFEIQYEDGQKVKRSSRIHL